jgi:uncharacterized protein DUF2460
MSEFPLLRTGAVTQYPSSRRATYSTSVTTFVDGTEQRFRELGGPVRSWVIRLHQLSAEEIGAIESFFEDRQGQFGVFAFTDPWDGTNYNDCSFDQDQFWTEAVNESFYQGYLIIRNNKP